MQFSSTYQPRYVVWQYVNGDTIVVGRTCSLSDAIVLRDGIIENGGFAAFGHIHEGK